MIRSPKRVFLFVAADNSSFRGDCFYLSRSHAGVVQRANKAHSRGANVSVFFVVRLVYWLLLSVEEIPVLASWNRAFGVLLSARVFVLFEEILRNGI